MEKEFKWFIRKTMDGKFTPYVSGGPILFNSGPTLGDLTAECETIKDALNLIYDAYLRETPILEGDGNSLEREIAKAERGEL